MSNPTSADRPHDPATAVEPDALQAVLAAAEPTRLQILFLLGRRGRLPVGEIAREFTISRPAISHHLKVLKTSGLVQTKREGQAIYYEVRRARVIDTLRAMADALEQCCPPGRLP